MKKNQPCSIIFIFILIFVMTSCRQQGDLEKPTRSNEILAQFFNAAENPEVILGWEDQVRIDRFQTLFQEVLSLAETNPNTVVELCIAGIHAPELSIRHQAAYILRFLTQSNQGFSAFETPEHRDSVVAAWKQWWNAHKQSFRIKTPPLEHKTLIVDEIPGRIHGNDEEPPGRILLLDRTGKTLWENEKLKMPYDAARLSDGNLLVNIIRARAVWKIDPEGNMLNEIKVGGYPCSLELLPGGNILVAGWDDGIPGFVREFDQSGKVIWGMENLKWPWKAQRLDSGNTLIADAGTNRVYEVTPQGEEVWAAAGLGPEKPELFDALGPVYCQRLDDGNTLISIRGLSRIVELDREGSTVWEVSGGLVKNQYSAVRLWNGNTLICDGGNFRVIEIDIDKNIIWEKTGIGYPAKAYRY